jgi:Family of unknown function (DUF6526)
LPSTRWARRLPDSRRDGGATKILIEGTAWPKKFLRIFANHTRFDTPFHFFIVPVFAISLIVTIVHLVMHPGVHSAWIVIFMLAATTAILKMRLYALRVQDRVIRLEERLRLAILLDEPLRTRVGELSESQLIGVRFASDAELPALAAKALAEKLSRADIKKAAGQWTPDYWRV